MAPTFSQLDGRNVVRTLTAGALTQLYRSSAFVRAATTDVDGVPLDRSFEKGEYTSIRRIKDYGVAEDYDPRSGSDAAIYDAEYVIVPLILDRLFTKGHPIYSSDAQVDTYVADYSVTVGGTITKAFDNYLYTRGFRDWTAFPASGAVYMADCPPVQLVFQENSSGALQAFGDNHLLDAQRVLAKNEIAASNNLYGRISVDACRGISADSTLVTGFAGAMAPGMSGSAIITDGIGLGVEFMRRGFNVASSNAITGQTATADIGDSAATAAISAVAADTSVFFSADTTIGTSNAVRGAVRITLGTTNNLAAGVAVGKICRLGASNGAAQAYGVILRVDAANKYVWCVPYSSGGVILSAAEITTGSGRFSIPAINSVNPFYHKEHLLFATRLLKSPSSGSGAIMQYAYNPERLPGVITQTFQGSYNVNQLRENLRGTLLTGAKPSDERKAVLALAA